MYINFLYFIFSNFFKKVTFLLCKILYSLFSIKRKSLYDWIITFTKAPNFRIYFYYALAWLSNKLLLAGNEIPVVDNSKMNCPIFYGRTKLFSIFYKKKTFIISGRHLNCFMLPKKFNRLYIGCIKPPPGWNVLLVCVIELIMFIARITLLASRLSGNVNKKNLMCHFSAT